MKDTHKICILDIGMLFNFHFQFDKCVGGQSTKIIIHGTLAFSSLVDFSGLRGRIFFLQKRRTWNMSLIKCITLL